MSENRVVIVRFWGLPQRYLIRQWQAGAPHGGWAQFGGSFTPGRSLWLEALNPNLVSSPYPGELMEFCLEEGWNLVAVIENEYVPETMQDASGQPI